MTAILLMHPNASDTPPQRRGPGRLPKSVTYLPNIRRRRAIEAREEAERNLARQEADIELHQQLHNLAVMGYRSVIRDGRPDTFADALKRVKRALNVTHFDDHHDKSDGAA